MAGSFASSPWALGVCDRCGFTYKLRDLKTERYNLRLTGLKVCNTCWDSDHPQLQRGRISTLDPQNLRDPRPDTGEGGSTGLFGWGAVGHELTKVSVATGTVTVSTT